MRRKITTTMIVAMAFGAAGCDDGTSSGVSRVSVRLTDAPGDFVSAEVEIVEAYLQGGGDDGEGDPRVVLFSGSEVFDLLDLQNGVTAELADVTIPSGRYAQLRLVIGDATITTADGKTYSTADNTLLCPSCAQSGLKVKLPGGAVDLDEPTQILLIDFDVAQSFGRAAGNSGRWVMHPVITATEFETTGIIQGSVALADGITLPECGGAQVGLAEFVPAATAGDVTFTGTTEADGDFRFAFVAPGTYSMSFIEMIDFENGETLTFSATANPGQVNVTSGANSTVDYTITGATCASS